MKVNGDGRECPEWCGTDHQLLSRNDKTSAWAFASLPPRADKPYVAASADEGMVFARTPAEAKEVAGLVRGLADFTPARIRQFAAQIDRATEAAFGAENELEAGA